MHTIRFDTFFKIWVQSRVGAIPRLQYTIKKGVSHLLPFILFIIHSFAIKKVLQIYIKNI